MVLSQQQKKGAAMQAQQCGIDCQTATAPSAKHSKDSEEKGPLFIALEGNGIVIKISRSITDLQWPGEGLEGKWHSPLCNRKVVVSQVKWKIVTHLAAETCRYGICESVSGDKNTFPRYIDYMRSKLNGSKRIWIISAITKRTYELQKVLK